MQLTQTPVAGSAVTYAAVQAALAAAAGAVTTVAGAIIAQTADIKTTKTAGLTAQNPTATDVTNTVQISPSVIWEGAARVIGSNRIMRVRVTLEPTTAGQLVFRVERDTGSGYSDAFLFYTSSPGQFVPGLAATRFLALGSNGAFILDQDNGGLLLGGSGETILSGRSGTQPFHVRGYAVASATDVFRFHAIGETKGEDETIVAIGDGTTWAQRAAITAGGQYLGTIWRVTDVQTGNYTAAAGQMVLCDTNTVGAFAVTLPTAVGVKGRMVGVMLVTSSVNAVTMNTTSSQTISLAGSGTTTVQDALGLVGAIFVSDGANWWRLKLT